MTIDRVAHETAETEPSLGVDVAKRKVAGVERAICWFFRNWLVVLLPPMLLLVSLPFFAPVAMQMGWTEVGRLLYTVYTAFCHQLPQRSWFFFGPELTYTLEELAPYAETSDPLQLRFFYGAPELGWKVAWSDRMVSFYFMTPVFILIYALLGLVGLRIRQLTYRLFLLAMAPLVLDGLTHLVSDLFFGISADGFRDTNVWLAALTGNAFPSFYAGDHLGTFNWWTRLFTGLLAAWAIAFAIASRLDSLLQREATVVCGRYDDGEAIPAIRIAGTTAR